MDRNPYRLAIAALILLILAVGVAFFPFGWRNWVDARYTSAIFSYDRAVRDLPAQRVAIVFGARVYPGGRLSSMLRDRVDTAIALYKAGKVDKLLVSGGNQRPDYNEPDAMMAYAVRQGVRPEDVQPDYGGRRTYDTCYRAQAVFGVSSAILVTQEFHLPRALFLCRNLGIHSTGVIADRRIYHPRSMAWSEAREVPALLVALVDILRKEPPPVLGDPIPIL